MVGKESGETNHVERWNNTLRQRICYYKGIAGDHYNVLLAAAAANFARWMRKTAQLYQQILACYQRLCLAIGRFKCLADNLLFNQTPETEWKLGGIGVFKG